MGTRIRFGIDDIKVVMFDLDGTVYYGSKIIPGANEAIHFFRNQGKSVFFTTNNSTKTRAQIFERLRGMGIDCNLGEVLTSGFLAALYALKNGLEDLYVFGSQDLRQELEEAGVSVCQDESASNLLIGYDPAMTYEGLTTAVRVAMGANRVMACNRERVYPGERALPMPGCGAMTAPVEWCANRECDVIIGKPSTTMVKLVCDEVDAEASEVLVIGDTYETDILMARRASCRSILIGGEPRRGVATFENIGLVPQAFVP